MNATSIVRFVQFVEWPATAFKTADDPMVIAVLGDDALVPDVEKAIASERVNGAAFSHARDLCRRRAHCAHRSRGALGSGARTGGAAGKSSVAIADKSGTASDQLQWKWQKGAGTVLADYSDAFSDDTRYEVCIYDGAGGTQPVFDAAIAGGGTCNGKPCWKAAGTSGFK